MRGQMQRPQAALQLAGIVTLNNHSRKPLLAPVAGPAADQCNLTWHQRPKRDNAGRMFEAAQPAGQPLFLEALTGRRRRARSMRPPWD